MNFKDLVAHAAGVDLDERVGTNPFLHAGHLGSIDSLPFPDESFDVVVCDNVLEHLDQPARVFSEVRRVLRPGGVFLGKTPNRYHYMPLVARATPLWFHRFVNRARGRASIDTFPTRYRANSRKDLARLAHEGGLELVALQTVEGRPEYLRMWPITYLVGHLYERLVNRFEALAGARVILIVEMRRRA
jgi:SAM-dependent methyltransferase